MCIQRLYANSTLDKAPLPLTDAAVRRPPRLPAASLRCRISIRDCVNPTAGEMHGLIGWFKFTPCLPRNKRRCFLLIRKAASMLIRGRCASLSGSESDRVAAAAELGHIWVGNWSVRGPRSSNGDRSGDGTRWKFRPHKCSSRRYNCCDHLPRTRSFMSEINPS